MKRTPHKSCLDDGNGHLNTEPSLVEVAPPVPGVAYDLQLQSLRRLMRATDIFSRRLIKWHKITGPQLVSLHKLRESDGLTLSHD
jgi:hypothetical protein